MRSQSGVIQKLLKENGATGLDESTVRIAADGPEPHRAKMCARPKPTAGYARTEHFASPERMARDFTKDLQYTARPALNQWGLADRGKPAPRVAHSSRRPARLFSGPQPRPPDGLGSGEERNAGPLQSKVELEPSPETIMDPIPARTAQARFDSHGCIS